MQVNRVDAVELMLGTDPKADPDRRQPVPKDLRLLLTAQPVDGALKPVAVLYRHRVPGTPPAARTTFSRPWRSEDIGQVLRLETASVVVAVQPAGYTVEAAIPLVALGWQAEPGTHLKADFGVLFGDAAGEVTSERSYWSNRSANFTTDVPGEAMLYPSFWGTLRCEES